MNFFPLSPRPALAKRSSPVGKGEILGLFRRGLPPPAPLRLNPDGTGAGAAYHAPTGGLPRRCQITLPSLSPTGGTAVLVAGFTSHITKFYPLSPRPPSPVGKGEFFGLFRRGLPPPAPLRLNPGGAGAGAAYHAPTGDAGGAGTVCHGASANAGLHQQFIREKFLGVWGLLSRSPRTLPCHGARREEFVTGQARTPDCISNSFGKVLGGLGASFKKPPTFLRFFVSSFLRVFSVIPHLRSADSMT